MRINHCATDDLAPEVKKWRARADGYVRRLTGPFRVAPVPVLLFGTGDSRLPVDLSALAKECNVKEVIFRRMLDRGGLAVAGAQFTVFVACTKENVKAFDEEYRERGGRGLPPDVRFTIAHELAHTFFFDLRNGKQVPKVSTDRYSVWEKLESECDRAACRLLIPIDPRETEVDLFDPAVMLSQAHSFGVTPRVLIERLDLRIGGFTDRRGGCFYVRNSPDDAVIRIIAWAVSGPVGVLLGNRLTFDGDFHGICDNKDFLANGGTLDDMRIKVRGETFRMRCSEAGNGGFIVTLELASAATLQQSAPMS